MSDKKNQNHMNPNQGISENKLILIKNPVICLIVIGLVGLVIRIYSYPYDLPVYQDISDYFWYAIDMSILGEFPQMAPNQVLAVSPYPGYSFPNNGWPVFLSLFFSAVNLENIQAYMDLQRWLTIAISISTIIPLYFLCTKFFGKYFSLLGTTLFAFQPRIIENSLLGGNEPLFLFLGVCALTLFLSKNIKIIYASFVVAGLFSLVRYEGLLILIPMTAVFFYRFRFSKTTIVKYAIIVGLVLLIILPMAYIRTETLGYDGLLSNIIAGPKYIESTVSSGEALWGDLEMNQASGIEKTFYFIQNGVQNLARYLAISLIPTFSFLVPVGIFFLCRKLDYNKITLIITLVVFLLPAFYAYSRDFQEFKYLFILFPIFSVVSMFTLRRIFVRNNESSRIFVVLLIGFLIFSVGYYVYFAPDLEHEQEALAIATIIKDTTKKVNGYYPEGVYFIHVIKNTDLEKFPILSTSLPPHNKIVTHFNWLEYVNDPNVKSILADDIQGINSVEDYIKFGEKSGLTHLVTDGISAQPKILNDIFYNEKNYPYLLKQFDSTEHGFKYHMKIYEIDFQLFEKYLENDFK
ncbi:glycosyltransferase family 39 protein [Marine Group I thaumarchaeote]|nr:glycosyltransferase family 39 protein [Marine Group I thaumarchaeote]